MRVRPVMQQNSARWAVSVESDGVGTGNLRASTLLAGAETLLSRGPLIESLQGAGDSSVVCTGPSGHGQPRSQGHRLD